MTQTPNLALDYLLPNQAQRYVTVNDNTRRLDAVVQLGAVSAGVADQPASPADGARYILPAGATGADWSGFSAGDVAAFQDGVWAAYPPAEGWCAEVADTGERLVFRAGGWTRPGRLGLNASPDAGNRLAVASGGVLFTHEAGGGSARVKVNKSAAGETASHLFQNAFSGRAEIGLVGDDKFRIKVSPDGSAWADALVVSDITGDAGFGVSAPQHRLDVSGAICRRRTAGQFHITNEAADASLAAGASLDFETFSGLIMVSSTSTGGVGLFLCGGGNTVLISQATNIPGSLNFAPSPNRYVFTNTTGVAATYRFLTLRVRDAA